MAGFRLDNTDSVAPHGVGRPLYTPEERARRDTSIWTPIQGVLAILQFLVFGVSLALVVTTLLTGTGADLALWSVALKTLILYTIMVTGSLWEKAVFGRYLFVPSFFWEDVVSMAVILSHTLYLGLWVFDYALETLLISALFAYGLYVINAAQFVLKLRRARLEAAAPTGSGPDAVLGSAV